MSCTRTTCNGSLWQCVQQPSGECQWSPEKPGAPFLHTVAHHTEGALHAEWHTREVVMHTSYHCDRRVLLEGDGYLLNVVCRMATCACSLVLRHLLLRPPSLPYHTVGTNKMTNLQFVAQTLKCSQRVDTYAEIYTCHSYRATGGSRITTYRPETVGRPSVVKDTVPQPRWQSGDAYLGFCVLCDWPTTTSDRWWQPRKCGLREINSIVRILSGLQFIDAVLSLRRNSDGLLCNHFAGVIALTVCQPSYNHDHDMAARFEVFIMLDIRQILVSPQFVCDILRVPLLLAGFLSTALSRITTAQVVLPVFRRFILQKKYLHVNDIC
ncbi:hypothetical protein CLF_105819 [Clonorchis sinensis]|uniref:Uncharacterized protein n=1 Tax=Clonorchis sinensis TaxID=79923 RepID=G7YE94_CLOSI|nr:hypothetical protein CLF_105819 [Clonorchis sinensis]